MKNITLDTGVEEYCFAGGGVVRFNPTDPNLYERFVQMQPQMKTLEKELTEKAEGLSGEDSVEATIALTVEADRQVKQLLNQVFGGDNDFDKALGGVNLLATAGNGQRVMANLMTLLENILAEGAERFAQDKADAIRQGR